MPTTPMLGRGAELAAACDLLWDPHVRLVSLLGPGGVGKTRLAIDVAEALVNGPGFSGGVAFVELSSVSVADELIGELARALGLGGGSSHTIAGLADALGDDDDVVVVLDNFEHVLGAAVDVAQLLSATRRLSVLVTSRHALDVAGEHRIELAPLDERSATELFLARARASRHGVDFDDADLAAVAAICARVDRLPLAIELAAARVRVLSPTAIRERLDRDLRLLDAGPVDRPERLRSMRAAIAWSVDALEPGDRALLVQLSIFAGSWDLTTAGQICARADDDLLDAVTRLLDHHLVRRAGAGRFALWDTVREHVAGERSEAVGAAHARTFHGIASAAAPHLDAPEQSTWLDRLDEVHGDLRAALSWSVHHDIELAEATAVALRRFWLLRGHQRDGLEWSRRILEAGGRRAVTPLRAELLVGAGLMQETIGDDAAAAECYAQAANALRELGDVRGLANAVRHLGNSALGMGSFAEAGEHFATSLQLAEGCGDGFLRAAAINGLGTVAYYEGRLEDAEARWSSAAAWFRANGVDAYLASMLNNLAELAVLRGDGARAVAIHEETLRLRDRVGDPLGRAQTQVNLGGALLTIGETGRARAELDAAMVTLRELGVERDLGACHWCLARLDHAEGRLEAALDHARSAVRIKHATAEPFELAQCLELVAAISVDASGAEHAAPLLGAAAAVRARLGARAYVDEPDGRAVLATIERRLGQRRVRELLGTGAAWSIEEAVQVAIGAVAPTPTGGPPTQAAALRLAAPSPLRSPDAAAKLGLTARELEVLGFLVRRYSDREIADELYISLRTVTTHVSRILTKLGVGGRREAADVALRLELVAA